MIERTVKLVTDVAQYMITETISDDGERVSFRFETSNPPRGLDPTAETEEHFRERSFTRSEEPGE